MIYKYLFGPVRSRRLGLSLGVDLVPAKTCSLDCLYCECGKTDKLTIERKEYVPTAQVLSELEHYLSNNPGIDYVTFSGSGEPTLHTGLGKIIEYLKKNHSHLKIALITNSSFLHLAQVREEILSCDLILPSLDAVSEKVFREINRPDTSIECSTVIEGLRALSNVFKGELWLEIFIVPGVNDTEEELSLFKKEILSIKPSRIQLNSLDRPGTCESLKPADTFNMNRIARFFSGLPVEIVSRKFTVDSTEAFSGNEQSIMAILKRRPCTVEDLAVSSGLTINNVMEIINPLIIKKVIYARIVEHRVYYST